MAAYDGVINMGVFNQIHMKITQQYIFKEEYM
jgi:hypothetical protein